jgi:hypothetical protein
MAALTQTYETNLDRPAIARKGARLTKKLAMPRCMIVSAGLILVGLSIPALMAFGLLTASFSLAFVGFALAATGGVLALIFCGEI